MITPGQWTPIVIAKKPVASRRRRDGLAATVQNELGLAPHSGLTVIFRVLARVLHLGWRA
jgi:transposase